MKLSARCAAPSKLFELKNQPRATDGRIFKAAEPNSAAIVAQFARNKDADRSTGRGEKLMDACHTVESNGDTLRGSSLKI